jgi:hypothetical protein
MLHLLPTEYLRDIRRDYVLRFGTIACYLGTFVFVVGICSLLPTYLWTESSMAENELPISVETASVALSQEELAAYNTDLRGKLVFLEQEKGTVITAPLSAVLEARTASVNLNSFIIENMNSPEETGVKIQLSGTAATRAGLSSFIERLKASNIFTGVDAPLSLFTKDKDIPFTITLIVLKP